MSNALSIPQLAEGQAAPELTTNDATKALGDALANKFSVDLTAGNVTVTTPQYVAAIFFNCINVAVGGRTVTLPAIDREFVLVESAAANTNDISLIVGSTTLTLSPGRLYLVRTDGTANGLVARDVGGTTEPNDLSVFVPGLMINTQLLYFRKATRAFTLPVSLTGSFFLGQAAATASTTVTLKKNGSSIGTLVWAAAGTVPTVTFASGISFAVGDSFSMHGPATADATLADTSFDFKASRP